MYVTNAGQQNAPLPTETVYPIEILNQEQQEVLNEVKSQEIGKMSKTVKYFFLINKNYFSLRGCSF